MQLLSSPSTTTGPLSFAKTLNAGLIAKHPCASPHQPDTRGAQAHRHSDTPRFAVSALTQYISGPVTACAARPATWPRAGRFSFHTVPHRRRHSSRNANNAASPVGHAREPSTISPPTSYERDSFPRWRHSSRSASARRRTAGFSQIWRSPQRAYQEPTAAPPRCAWWSNSRHLRGAHADGCGAAARQAIVLLQIEAELRGSMWSSETAPAAPADVPCPSRLHGGRIPLWCLLSSPSRVIAGHAALFRGPSEMPSVTS